jgi:diacylglycerol kinase family enzyme
MAEALTSAGYVVEITSEIAEMAALSAAGIDSIRTVVAAGGDGTASVVRRSLPREIPLIPVPMGTENLLARYLSQKSAAASVRAAIDRGVIVDLDLGRANGQEFLLMMSAGFDADVVRRLHENRRGNIQHTSYLKPILQAIRSYRYPELQLYCGDDGQAAENAAGCRWLFAFNLPVYAMGWRIAPEASGADGLLDVCTFERGSFSGGLRYLYHVLRGTHADLPDVRLARSRGFRLEAANRTEVPYQLDGDFAGMLPVDVDVLPGQLRLLVSRRTARRLGFQVAGDPAT